MYLDARKQCRAEDRALNLGGGREKHGQKTASAAQRGNGGMEGDKSAACPRWITTRDIETRPVPYAGM